MREFIDIAQKLPISPIDLNRFIEDHYDANLSLDDNVKNLILFETI